MMDKKGFLLLEVIVCVALLAIGITYIARSYAVSRRAAEMSETLVEAASLLTDRMFDVEMRGLAPAGTKEGGFGDSVPYRWTETVTAVGETDLAMVVTEVAGTNNRDNHPYAVVTYQKIKKNEGENAPKK